MRGGERVLERIASVAAQIGDVSALYTMFDDGRPHAPAIDAIPRRCARLGARPGALRARRWLLPLYPRAVADLSRQLARDHAREPVDLLISTSSAAIKGLQPPEGVAHICYCHSPARYIWSRTEDYGGKGAAARLRRLGLGVIGPSFRRWDRRTAARVTRFLANSSHTASEIQRCYGREADVVFPPVRTDYFTAHAEQPWSPPGAQGSVGQACSLPAALPRRERFWLVVSALEPYKRIDVAIEAARLAGTQLIIAGDGSCRRDLARAAGPLVRFEGSVSDERLRELYRTAAVLLFPQIEDFGIVCAEAQACGLPVAAAGEGGALDIIIDGVTGAFAPPTDPRALAEAARRAAGLSPAACADNAGRFAEARFDDEMRRLIATALPLPRKTA